MDSNTEIKHPIGPLWLQRINLDIITAIVSWLDPMSMLHLSWTCNAFFNAIESDSFIWRRALRNITAEHCIAPRSLPELSIRDMKRISTRPNRLHEGFRDPQRPLCPTLEQYTLDYGTFLNNGSSDSIDTTLDIDCMEPFLLPGGRWIISNIVDNKGLSTHLFCWDRMASPSGGSPLQPAAFFSWNGSTPKDGEWLKAQYDGPQTVTIACTLWDDAILSYYMLRLSWKDDSDVPLMQCIAQLSYDSRYMDRHYFQDGELHGEYIVFDTVGSITIWNWRDNLMGTVKSEQHEWTDGWGFVSIAISSYLYIFHYMLGSIVILEIPKLYPVGTNESLRPIPPASIVSYPLLPCRLEGPSWSSALVLDRWKPPCLRSGIIVLHSRRPLEMGGSLFHVLSLHGMDAPSYSRQEDDSFLPHKDSEYGRASLVDALGGGMLAFDCLTSPNVTEETLDSRFFPFVKDGTLGEPIRRQHLLQLPYTGKLGPLCFVSGTTMLMEKQHGPQQNTQLVWIVSFDSDSRSCRDSQTS
ncbi:hypothetical protein DL93DRAFT_2172579 [Clavulina sp. PMI_390]|nr:hypothetical protein DL93DRAFT_2172579 [Clavulina sp. PMI_390]